MIIDNQWCRQDLSQVGHGLCLHDIRQKFQEFLHKYNK